MLPSRHLVRPAAYDDFVKYLRSFFAYRFTCRGHNSRYIAETTHHLAMWIKEPLETDSKSNILKHLSTNKNYKEVCDIELLET